MFPQDIMKVVHASLACHAPSIANIAFSSSVSATWAAQTH